MEKSDPNKSINNQVGGHSGSLQFQNGKLLKQFQNNNRGTREVAFYERVFQLQSTDPADDSSIFKALQSLIPEYFGQQILSINSENGSTIENTKFLVLEDLTDGRKSPCIMDVKMGTRTYESTATQEKIEYEKQKFAIQETVGFRIQGIKVWNDKTQSYLEFDKYYGRQVKIVQELPAAFAKYFPWSNKTKTIALLNSFLCRLKEFEAWFDKQNKVEFIASSLLFLYNGEGEHLNPDIRLIDFAHVTYVDNKKDHGVLFGIQRLQMIFETLLNDIQQDISQIQSE